MDWEVQFPAWRDLFCCSTGVAKVGHFLDRKGGKGNVKIYNRVKDLVLKDYEDARGFIADLLGGAGDCYSESVSEIDINSQEDEDDNDDSEGGEKDFEKKGGENSGNGEDIHLHRKKRIRVKQLYP